MRLRVLRSVALAAALLAAELVHLTLYLNPAVRAEAELVPLVLGLFVPWTVLAALGLLAVALTASLLPPVRTGLQPPFPGLPWLTSLLLVALSIASALAWWNLLSYRHSIPVSAFRGLLGSAALLTASVLVLLGVMLDVLLFPARARSHGPRIVIVTVVAALFGPALLRPAPDEPATPIKLSTERTAPLRRVILLGVDGIGPRQLHDGVARGTLPGFARLMRLGAHGPLATLRPTEGPPIWTSIVTGRLPRDHGVKSFLTYTLGDSPRPYELLPKGALVGVLQRHGFVTPHSVTSAARRRAALWEAANAFGVSAGVVRVWATWPAEPVQGFMLSPYWHVLADDPAQAARTLHPADLLAEVQARIVEPHDVDRALMAEFVDPTVDAPGEDGRRELLEKVLAADLTYQRAGAVLRSAYDPPLFVSYQYGLDVVGHVFTRYAEPGRFGDVGPEAVRKYGRVTERYAAMLAEWVDATARGLEPDEVLIVVSGYGMEPVPLWRRVLDAVRRDEPRSGTHEGAPDGYFIAVGPGIRPGAVIEGASVLDVAPTVLYLMGLPVGRDMEGRVLAEMLDRTSRAQPVTFVPSYESLVVTAPASTEALEPPPLPDEMP